MNNKAVRLEIRRAGMPCRLCPPSQSPTSDVHEINCTRSFYIQTTGAHRDDPVCAIEYAITGIPERRPATGADEGKQLLDVPRGMGRTDVITKNFLLKLIHLLHLVRDDLGGLLLIFPRTAFEQAAYDLPSLRVVAK